MVYMERLGIPYHAGFPRTVGRGGTERRLVGDGGGPWRRVRWFGNEEFQWPTTRTIQEVPINSLLEVKGVSKNQLEGPGIREFSDVWWSNLKNTRTVLVWSMGYDGIILRDIGSEQPEAFVGSIATSD